MAIITEIGAQDLKTLVLGKHLSLSPLSASSGMDIYNLIASCPLQMALWFLAFCTYQLYVSRISVLGNLKYPRQG